MSYTLSNLASPKTWWISSRTLLLLPVLALVTACSDSIDSSLATARDWQVQALLQYLPEEPLAVLTIDSDALEQSSQAGLGALLDTTTVAEPAINRLADELLFLTTGIDAAS